MIRSKFADFFVLAVVTIVVRLSFFSRFDLVTFDGTYYIRQAKALLGFAHTGGAFPLGYPLVVAPFIPLVRDGVTAAQVASLFAGVVSALLFLALCKRYLAKWVALLCALLFSLHPLFIQASVVTMSESTYLAWLLASVLLIETRRSLLLGICLGLLTITRPEGLAIAVIVLVWRARRKHPVAVALLCFLAIYAANAAVLSATTHRLVLLPKSQQLGLGVEPWLQRESSLGYSGQSDAPTDAEERSALTNYVTHLVGEGKQLALRASPLLVLFALFGVYRRPSVILSVFAPLLIYPAFLARSEPRFVLSYIPFLALFAFVGASEIKAPDRRRLAYTIVVLGAVLNIALNRDLLQNAYGGDAAWARVAGAQLKPMVDVEDRIADRKPFFAFYAGGRYVEIPIAPYDATLNYLIKEDVMFLSLDGPTIKQFRPALAPLLFDPLVIRGELRFRQLYRAGEDAIIYKRSGGDGLEWRKLCEPIANHRAPQWSPNGRWIAFRDLDQENNGGIYVVPVEGGGATKISDVGGADYTLSWSPDSRRIAFTGVTGSNVDIFSIDVYTGKLDRLTTSPATDTSPSWASGSNELAFCSDRSGQTEVWLLEDESGRLHQITHDGGNAYPAISPTGQKLAWITRERRLRILDRRSGQTRTVADLRSLSFRPTWSPDEAFIAAESSEWGSLDVYLVHAETGTALLLTKGPREVGMPSWSPDGGAIALVSTRDGHAAVWIATGLEPYLAQLTAPDDFVVLSP